VFLKILLKYPSCRYNALLDLIHFSDEQRRNHNEDAEDETPLDVRGIIQKVDEIKLERSASFTGAEAHAFKARQQKKLESKK
jgi:hypothetical protein